MRKLTVKKERLAELTTDDLRRVAGAGAPTKECLESLARDCIATLYGCTTAITCPRPQD